jgi:hypothetical protein
MYWSQRASEKGPRGNYVMDSDSSESDGYSGLKQNIRVRHIIYKVQRQTSRYLICPLIVLMPRPSSPVGDPDQEVGDAVWKRRYLALQESVNTEKSSKRKSQ